jgi:hypothetical protein
LASFTAFRQKQSNRKSLARDSYDYLAPIGCFFFTRAANGLRLLSPAIKVGATIQVDQPNPINRCNNNNNTATKMAHSYQTTRGCSSLALWWGDHHQGGGIRLHSTAVATCKVVFTERIKYERPSSAAGSTTGKVATFRPAESPKRVAPVPQLLIEWPITCSQQPEQQQDTAEIHLASSNFHPSPSGRLLTPDPPSKKKIHPLLFLLSKPRAATR